MSLKGKNALVTGSTSGMGLGIAKALGEAGANVMMNGFGDPDLVKKCVAEVKGDRSIKVLHQHADLAKPAEVVGLVQAAEKTLGSVDILVNNAGIQHVAPIEDFPPERWDALIAVNLSAAFHAIRTAMPGMRKRNWGRIVNNASASGLHGSALKTAYCASKFGIIGLTKSVALEAADTFITCNAICPGWVMSGMSRPQIEAIAQREGVSFEKASEILVSGQPNKRFIKPSEIGALVVYLCSDAAGPITGSACEIDGGIAAK